MKKIWTLLLIFSLCFQAQAQQDDPGLPDDDPDVPLDGGVGLLLAAGIAYGLKRVRSTKP